MRHVRTVGECWLWRSALTREGYGHFWFDGRMVEAHIVSYAFWCWGTPPGLELDHRCRNRRCVRPSHLEPVTHAVNMARGHYALLTHCPHGHPYDEANTQYHRNGARRCRTCRALSRKRAALW